MLRKFVVTAAAPGVLGYAAFAPAPAQAAGTQLGLALNSPALETPVVEAACVHRRRWSGWRCWHSRWESRPRWHRRWRSRRWWW